MRELELTVKSLVPVESASAFIDEKIKEFGDWRGNQIRGLLLDRSITLQKGRCQLEAAFPGVLGRRNSEA